MASTSTTKAHCNMCGPDRNHEVLHRERTEGSEQYDQYSSIDWWDLYEMLRCAGCGNITMRHTSYFSEHDGTSVVYYPPAVARREPRWMSELLLSTKWLDFNEQRTSIHDLLKEVYVALHNDSRNLAGMGVRAILDQVMTEKVGDRHSFVRTLEAFKEGGFLSDHQAETLDTILEAGHATVHRGWRPSLDDLDTLLDVTESLIASTYIHERKAKDLAKRVPPRPPNANREARQKD